MQAIRPQEGPQTAFLSASADIAVYGGAAGGGKTFALLLEPLRHIGNPGFQAAVFRRTVEQVRNEGGLWSESLALYPHLGGIPSETRLAWKFPSGSSIRFRHLQYEKDKLQYQGAQFAFIGFDELTHFTESQFFYLLSRSRSTCGVRPYIRATTNPDANSWVKRFLAPWVDGRSPQPARSGETRWFLRDGGEIHWIEAQPPTRFASLTDLPPLKRGQDPSSAKSVTFVSASLSDNKILMARDPGYLANLQALALVDRKRLLEGDWDIVEGGNLFRREWFEVLGAVPSGMRFCRFWDLAATASKLGKDPDWTAGVLLGVLSSGMFAVVDVVRARATPAGVESLIRQTAELDKARFGHVSIRMEQEPGSSGVGTVDRYVRIVLSGFDFRGVRSSGAKEERARPLSAQAEAGNVKLVSGAWNDDFLNELCAFPTPGQHDDQVDAASGALAALTGETPFRAVYGGREI